MVLSGVVAMVTCAVFLRLSCVLHLAVLLLFAALYTYIIKNYRYKFHSGHVPVFLLKGVENKMWSPPPVVVRSHHLCRNGVCVVLMLMFVVVVLFNSRQVDSVKHATSFYCYRANNDNPDMNSVC